MVLADTRTMVPGPRTKRVAPVPSKGAGRTAAPPVSSVAPHPSLWPGAGASRQPGLPAFLLSAGHTRIMAASGEAWGPRRAEASVESSVSRLGFYFLLIFVFISISRIFDLWLNNLHIPLVFSLLAAVFAALDGAFQRAFRSRTGKLMAMFAVWLVVCVPFSQWRGGSFGVLTDTFFKSFLVFAMAAGSVTTVARVRSMLLTIGLAASVVMVIANVMQARVRGRLMMPTGFLANPNDLAQLMLVGMCFIPIWAVGKSLLARGTVTLLMFPFLYTVFDTGSRAALLALLVLGCVVFWYATVARKVALLVVFLALGASLFSVSQNARARLQTLFASGGNTESDDIARTSTAVRTYALRQSLEMTIRNPIFGVGPAGFANVAADLSHEDGQRAAWVETHNSYTQVSSEMGIPGFVFLGGAVMTCLLGLTRVRKMAARAHDAIVLGTANHVLAGFGIFAFVSTFVSVAYQFHFSLMIGVAAASLSVLEKELRARTPQAAMRASTAEGRLGPGHAANRNRG